MSLLDTILDNSSVRILSEQHDAGAINFVAGLSDPGEMIRCGYRPELRRLPNEQDAEYAERIRPLVMALPAHEREKIMGAAIRRAALDTSNGKIAVMVAGKAPWHGLGVHVADALHSRDAITLASLDWTVSKRQLTYQYGENSRTADGVYALVRDDTGACLGTSSKQFQVVQNQDGFDFLDAVLEATGARYESAGSLFGGQQVWMLARLPEQAFEVADGDRQECYVLFTNSHVPGTAARCLPTVERVVCANTQRIALAKSRGKGLTIRHTGNLKGKIADAQEALGLAVTGFEEYRKAAEVLVSTPCPDVRHYVNDVLDAVLDVTAAQALLGADALAAAVATTDAQLELARKSFESKLEKRADILEDILQRYDGEACSVGGIRGTAWAALNAVTEHSDHRRRYRGSQEEKQSRRFEQVLWGDQDELKQVALTKALELAKS